MPERLAALIRERQPCVVLTGAGVSTESGIPDFRSPTGIWATVSPLEYASLSAFRRDPERVWSFYRLRVELLAAAEPNRVHHALAELERRGLVEAVVTQNIDCLHERAGSQEVVEVHGSIRSASCPRCRETHALADVLAQLAASEAAPTCRACGAILKPDVVFFEEMLPPEAIDRAYDLSARAGLLLVLGTSLEVHPVAGLPDVTRRAGGTVAIVNVSPTGVDQRAALVLREPAGDVLERVLALV